MVQPQREFTCGENSWNSQKLSHGPSSLKCRTRALDPTASKRPSVVDRMTPFPQNDRVLLPRTSEYVMLHGKGESKLQM